MKTPTKSQKNIFENQLRKMLGIDFDISQQSEMARFSQIIRQRYPLEKDQFFINGLFMGICDEFLGMSYHTIPLLHRFGGIVADNYRQFCKSNPDFQTIASYALLGYIRKIISIIALARSSPIYPAINYSSIDTLLYEDDGLLQLLVKNGKRLEDCYQDCQKLFLDLCLSTSYLISLENSEKDFNHFADILIGINLICKDHQLKESLTNQFIKRIVYSLFCVENVFESDLSEEETKRRLEIVKSILSRVKEKQLSVKIKKDGKYSVRTFSFQPQDIIQRAIDECNRYIIALPLDDIKIKQVLAHHTEKHHGKDIADEFFLETVFAPLICRYVDKVKKEKLSPHNITGDIVGDLKVLLGIKDDKTANYQEICKVIGVKKFLKGSNVEQEVEIKKILTVLSKILFPTPKTKITDGDYEAILKFFESPHKREYGENQPLIDYLIGLSIYCMMIFVAEKPLWVANSEASRKTGGLIMKMIYHLSFSNSTIQLIDNPDPTIHEKTVKAIFQLSKGFNDPNPELRNRAKFIILLINSRYPQPKILMHNLINQIAENTLSKSTNLLPELASIEATLNFLSRDESYLNLKVGAETHQMHFDGIGGGESGDLLQRAIDDCQFYRTQPLPITNISSVLLIFYHQNGEVYGNVINVLKIKFNQAIVDYIQAEVENGFSNKKDDILQAIISNAEFLKFLVDIFDDKQFGKFKEILPKDLRTDAQKLFQQKKTTIAQTKTTSTDLPPDFDELVKSFKEDPPPKPRKRLKTKKPSKILATSTEDIISTVVLPIEDVQPVREEYLEEIEEVLPIAEIKKDTPLEGINTTPIEKASSTQTQKSKKPKLKTEKQDITAENVEEMLIKKKAQILVTIDEQFGGVIKNLQTEILERGIGVQKIFITGSKVYVPALGLLNNVDAVQFKSDKKPKDLDLCLVVDDICFQENLNDPSKAKQFLESIFPDAEGCVIHLAPAHIGMSTSIKFKLNGKEIDLNIYGQSSQHLSGWQFNADRIRLRYDYTPESEQQEWQFDLNQNQISGLSESFSEFLVGVQSGLVNLWQHNPQAIRFLDRMLKDAGRLKVPMEGWRAAKDILAQDMVRMLRYSPAESRDKFMDNYNEILLSSEVDLSFVKEIYDCTILQLSTIPPSRPISFTNGYHRPLQEHQQFL